LKVKKLLANQEGSLNLYNLYFSSIQTFATSFRNSNKQQSTA